MSDWIYNKLHVYPRPTAKIATPQYAYQKSKILETLLKEKLKITPVIFIAEYPYQQPTQRQNTTRIHAPIPTGTFIIKPKGQADTRVKSSRASKE